MATQVKFRRGSTTDHSTFTGVQGEITVDTDLNTIRVHDGNTQGGHRVLLHSEFVGSGTGTVTNIETGTGLTGGPIATTGTIAIESTYITKIDSSYSWGNHASIGYLTDLSTSTVGSLSDVEITNPQANQVLAFNTNGNKWTNVAQSGSGGASGTFIGLSDSPTQFSSGDAGKLLAVNSSYNAIEFVSAAGEANTATNRGTGEGSVFYTKAGVDLQFRTIKAGSNISITQNSNEITVNAGASAFSGGTGINIDGANEISVDNTVALTSGNFNIAGVYTFAQSPVFSNGLTNQNVINVPITGSTDKEVFIKATVSDAANDFLDLSNLSTTTSTLSPAIRGGVSTIATVPALTLTGEVPSNRDTGTTPLMEFTVRRGSNVDHSANFGLENTLSTRPLYRFNNHTSNVLTINHTGTVIENSLTVNGITDIPHVLKFKNQYSLLSGLQAGIPAATYPGCFAVASNAPYFSATSNSGEWIKLALDSAVPNVFNTLGADTGGPRTPQSAQDQLTITGGSGIDTDLSYDSGTGVTTLTITNTGSTSGGTLQDLWKQINADTGNAIANSATDALTIAGGTGINTSIVGDTLTITNSLSGNINNIKDIKVSGQNTVSVSGLDQEVEFEAGSNMTITTSGNKVIFASSGGSSSSNAFSTISIASQSDVVAESASDTLTLTAGNGIGLSTNAGNDEITITNTANAAYAFTNINVTGSNNITATTASDTLTLVGGTNVTLVSDNSTDTVTINATASSQNAFTTFAVPTGTNVIADTATDTVTFSAGSGITITGSDTNDTITFAAATSLESRSFAARTFEFGTSGNAYTISDLSGTNPTIILLGGHTYCFDLSVNGHPFRIQTVSNSTTGTLYSTGLKHWSGTTWTTGSSAQGKESGLLFWTVPHTISGSYYYQCAYHGGMWGTITIKDITALS